MIRFDRPFFRDVQAAANREWLETNGLGGFASSTVCGANTRRYHGLLVAALKPPVERYVLLSKLEETVVSNGKDFELATNFYPDATHPTGYRLLEEFRLDPFPSFVWRIGEASVQKTVCLIQEANTVVVEYRSSAPIVLELRPLIAYRQYHALTHANGALQSKLELSESVVSIRPYADLPALHFLHNGGGVSETGMWYRRFQYPRERERGLDYEEDLFEPFLLTFDIRPDKPARVVASIEPVGELDAVRMIAEEKATRLPSSTLLEPALRRAARQFLVSRGETKTIVAGYHWFTDWGRDTMISLPGLMRAAGSPKQACLILRAFAQSSYQGLLPNRFTDSGEKPEYNAADAALWFAEAARDNAVEFYAVLKEIIAWRERGTLYDIHLTSDGLITGGWTESQLTWMDAKVDGRAITPRHGKPVEIEALWYNLLLITAEAAGQLGDVDYQRKCRELADQAKVAFLRIFWNDAAQCLFDVIGENGPDGSIRPNQLLALSLTHPILPRDRGEKVLEIVQRELLTPFGLRTLSPRDPSYQGRYEGGPVQRDAAYHQGTVWPWLLGPFARAHSYVYGKTANLGELLAAFEPHLLDAGVGQISEIFDGDPPHEPRGCIAQAWSVAELYYTSLFLRS